MHLNYIFLTDLIRSGLNKYMAIYFFYNKIFVNKLTIILISVILQNKKAIGRL